MAPLDGLPLTITLEQAEDLLACDRLDLSDAMAVSEDHTDLGWGHTAASELADCKSIQYSLLWYLLYSNSAFVLDAWHADIVKTVLKSQHAVCCR